MGSSNSSNRDRTRADTRSRTQRNRPQTVANQPPPAMPQHLMQHQHPSYQQRAPPAAPQGPPMQHHGAAQVNAAVKEAKNVVALCTVHPKSIQLVGDCLYFVVTTMVDTCTYEIHTGVTECIRKGDVIFTPHRADKMAPQPISIEGEHDELDLVAPIEDLDQLNEADTKYVKEQPKRIPLAIVLHYITPDGESLWEYTYVSLNPKAEVIRQMVRTKEGIFKVDTLYGGDEDDGAAVAVIADGSSPTDATNLVDDGEGDECVICLTNAKDTAVIPCRHLCLCKDCAEPLRRQSPKCPVCRGPIDQLLHIGRKSD